MKECTKCKEVKELSEFYKDKSIKSGYASSCVSCVKDFYTKNKHKYKANAKEYNQKNKDYIKEKRKTFYNENKERLLKEKREKYKENPSKFRDRGIENRLKEDKDKKREYMRSYVSEMLKDDLFKFKFNIRTLVRNSIKGKGYTKRSKSFDILGVDFETFKTYLSRQFKKGMTWSNHGEWHLDHIIPMASAKTEEEAIKLNHYTNFSPEWAIDNLKKSDTIIEGTQITIKI